MYDNLLFWRISKNYLLTIDLSKKTDLSEFISQILSGRYMKYNGSYWLSSVIKQFEKDFQISVRVMDNKSI